MKKRIFILTILTILIIATTSYGAIEIVPSNDGTGKDQIVNTTISNSYLVSQAMKNAEGSLYGSTVLPHLATNKDWGAVSYLSNSIYGTNTEGGATGIQLTIDGVKYYSTNGNATGVMNWGANPNVTRYTQTTGLISVYNNETSTAKEKIAQIYNNRNTEFVDFLNYGDTSKTKGMAIHETSGIYGTRVYANNQTWANNWPVSLRYNLFGIYIGADNYSTWRTDGEAWTNVTFRPVIWNR